MKGSNGLYGRRLLAILLLGFALGGCVLIRPAPQTTEPAAQTVSCRDIDDDNDGVSNCDDRCAGSTPGTLIGPDGCPMEPMINPGIERFPTRPPRTSVFRDLRNSESGLSPGMSLGQADDHLCAALLQAGYSSVSHYSYSGGFALATELERIQSDGSPDPLMRWMGYAQAMNWSTLDLLRYGRILFNADQSYYRILVFIVSDQPVSPDTEEAAPASLQEIVARGSTSLPYGLRDDTFGQQHRLTVLVYPIELLAVGRTPRMTKLNVSLDDHLVRSGLIAALARPPLR